MTRVLLGRARGGHLPVRALLLVQRPHVGHHEPGRHQRLLNSVPNRIMAVVELDGHPAPRLEPLVVAGESLVHQLLVIAQGLAFGLVDDCFGRGIRAALRATTRPRKFRSA